MYNLSPLELEVSTQLDRLAEVIGNRIERTVTWENLRDSKSSSTRDLEVAFKVGPHEYVANFCLTSLPGNDAIVVSTDQYVYERFRNVGIGSLLTRAKMDIIRSVGCQMLIATVNATNTYEIRLLTELGWSTLVQFSGGGSGLVNLWKWQVGV
jgi:ribosomal protein S18 acetylase RimI-like enzyme